MKIVGIVLGLMLLASPYVIYTTRQQMGHTGLTVKREKTITIARPVTIWTGWKSSNSADESVNGKVQEFQMTDQNRFQNRAIAPLRSSSVFPAASDSVAHAFVSE